MNEFGRIKEIKEIDELRMKKERKQKTHIDDDIIYVIKNMSLQQLQAQNNQKRK